MRVRTAVVVTMFISLSAMIFGCGSKSPTEPTPSCAATISPAARGFDGAGGGGTVTVTVAAGCSWTSASSSDWTAVTAGGAGNGPGNVSYTVAANQAAQPRTATLTIAGQVHAISQQGRAATVCTFALTPATATYNKDAAEGAFAVAAPDDCSWTATSSASWLTFAGGQNGLGSGSVSYRLARNLDTTDRTATIAVADQRFTVKQGGDSGACQYAVAPVDLSLCMAGQTVTTTVTTDASCTWTATPEVPWLTVTSGVSGTGTATVTVSVADNYDAPRTGTILVRWPAPTLGQNVRIAQAGCRYAVSTSSAAVPAAGGTSSFDVIQQSDPTECGGATQDRCVWSAVADVPWLTITTPMPRTGDNPVSFTAAPNPGAAARVGRIVVRDKVVLVTQPGQ